MQIIFYLIWLLLLAILQPTLARGIELWGIAPNLILSFVIIAGFFRGKTEGAICGIIFGLLYDLLIGRMIGVNSLCYLYLGYGSGILSERFFSGRKRVAVMLVSAVATILAGLFYYFARLAIHGDVGFVAAFFRIALPESLYNSGMSFLMCFPVVGMMKLMRMKQIS